MNMLFYVTAISGFGVAFRLGDSVNSRIPNTCKTLTSETCVFPFKYQGVTYSQCTYTDSPMPWCATSVDSQGTVQNNKWGDCDTSSPFSGCQVETLSFSPCNTPQGECQFPFRYQGSVYRSCTTAGRSSGAAWCSLQTTQDGTHVEGRVGECPSTCQPVDTTGPLNPATTTTTTTSTTTRSTTTTVPLTPTTTASLPTTTTTALGLPPCSTESGPAPVGSQCVFPFTFSGITHTTCADWVYGGEHQGKK